MALVVFRKKILFLGKIDISNSEMLLEILPFYLFYFFIYLFFFINRDLYYHYITYNTFTTKFKVTKNYN